MTRDELLAKLNDQARVDPEGDHGDAEDWLLAFVNDPAITKAWNDRASRVGWWYA